MFKDTCTIGQIIWNVLKEADIHYLTVQKEGMMTAKTNKRELEMPVLLKDSESHT